MTGPDRQLVVVMAKRPEAGATKTRLAPLVGPEGAAELYEAFLLDTLDLATRVPDTDVAIAYHPPDAADYFAGVAPDARLLPQVGDDLGQRLDHVIGAGLDGGGDRVVAINSDSPHLPPARITEAFAALATGKADVVLGPAADGGYYLIGVTDRPGRLVTGVTMSTPTVLADTVAVAEEAGLTVALLDEWYDVDEPEDLLRLRRDLATDTDQTGRPAPRTRAVLDRLLLPSVIAVIPALDEEATIADAVERCRAQGVLDDVVVAVNASTDRTAARAAEAGAVVVDEPRRGYGFACAAGAAEAARRGADVIVFLDADLSSPPEELTAVVEPILAGRADLVLGSRVLGRIDAGAMPVHQRVGNAGSAWLMRRLYGVSVTDLGPFRAIRTDLLDRLSMQEMTFGWPTEMTVKAARAGSVIVEVPVSWHRRAGGRSKVGGTVRGSLLAARHILGTTIAYGILDRRWRPGPGPGPGAPSADDDGEPATVQP